jgi:hypothetical protein
MLINTNRRDERMTNDASWKLQISVKTPSGTLINCRGEHSQEILGQLAWVQENAGQILATEQALSASGTIADAMPLAAPQAPPGFSQTAAPSLPVSPPVASAAPPFPGASGGAAPSQWQQPYGQPLQSVPQQGQQPGPVCSGHGLPAKVVPGGISKTGKPYRSFLACSLPRDQQCSWRQDAA